MTMYYTEVKDASGVVRKVPVSWSKPHYPHERTDMIRYAACSLCSSLCFCSFSLCLCSSLCFSALSLLASSLSLFALN